MDEEQTYDVYMLASARNGTLYPTADDAMAAEKHIKRWRRALRRIEAMNPQRLELYLTLNN